jgi:hypothetical protein
MPSEASFFVKEIIGEPPREAGSATTKARWGRLAERSLRSAARRAMIRRARQNRAAPVGMTAMRRTGEKEKADLSTAGAAPFDSAPLEARCKQGGMTGVAEGGAGEVTSGASARNRRTQKARKPRVYRVQIFLTLYVGAEAPTS